MRISFLGWCVRRKYGEPFCGGTKSISHHRSETPGSDSIPYGFNHHFDFLIARFVGAPCRIKRRVRGPKWGLVAFDWSAYTHLLQGDSQLTQVFGQLLLGNNGFHPNGLGPLVANGGLKPGKQTAAPTRLENSRRRFRPKVFRESPLRTFIVCLGARQCAFVLFGGPFCQLADSSVRGCVEETGKETRDNVQSLGLLQWSEHENNEPKEKPICGFSFGDPTNCRNQKHMNRSRLKEELCLYQITLQEPA